MAIFDCKDCGGDVSTSASKRCPHCGCADPISEYKRRGLVKFWRSILLGAAAFGCVGWYIGSPDHQLLYGFICAFVGVAAAADDQIMNADFYYPQSPPSKTRRNPR
jgi:hypothetical protein